jgi:hypothetical protein
LVVSGRRVPRDKPYVWREVKDRGVPKFSTAVTNAFPSFADDFSEVEDGIGEWAARLRDVRQAVRDGHARAETNEQNNVQFLTATYLGGVAVRVREQADGVVSLVNKGNPHAAAPVSRSLFETCCVPIYLGQQMLPRLRKGRVKQVHELVFRFGLGTSINTLEAAHIRPIKVGSLLGSSRAELTALASGLPEEEQKDFAALVDIFYGPLSDLTHPNFSAVTLSVEVGLPPTFHHPTPFDDWSLHAVVSSAAYILGAGGRAFDQVINGVAEHPMDLPSGDPLLGETD